MTHSRYLRDMARLMRVRRQLSVDQLAKRLALPRSTIYYWVRDLPLRERSAVELGTLPGGVEPSGARTGGVGTGWQAGGAGVGG
ncbi:MAG TPA: hypothetical protein VK761_00310, partial [Solirubrobacteraceae bacterium]|nr:hypothetical protein [Solirubrobacteraceae bacterium]